MTLPINPKKETKKITSFIKATLKEQGFENVVIGVSGGIDSTTCLSFLQKSIPLKNIVVAHLYYFKSEIRSLLPFLQKLNIPQKNIYNISIKNIVDEFKKNINLSENSENYKIRLGNIMARTRMILLYDLAKKHNALVCGTENKSEYLLGYFTRFGDEASDLEPIKHLYKTQIFELARYLDLPKKIINQAPTAGLWTGQTDENDFGFSYQEADQVLNLYFDQKKSLSEILLKQLPNAQKIINWFLNNSFKHHLPYAIK
jgi:NAD+ synthase